jgi:hypothetical protein
MIAEITTKGNNHCLLVACRLVNLGRTMKMSEDLHPGNMIAEITTEGNSPKFLTGTIGGIVMQLILGCNDKTTVMFL